MSSTTRKLLKYGLPIAILIVAGVLTYSLIAGRERPAREEPERAAALVETMRVERGKHRLDVRASGEVVPARQVTVTPQVSGKIVAVDPQLVPGGLLEAGDEIIQIDPSDYQLAVEQRETAVEQARAQLEIEQGQQEIARREWELFKDEAERLNEGDETQDPSLALREPQLKSAKAQLDAALAQLEEARLNLERTSIPAPFDAVVREESVAEGQVVGPPSQIATLVGTDQFWVRLSLGTDKIPHIDIPNVNAEKGSTATVRYEVGDRQVTRKARVVRLLGDLDPQGRMARLLLEVDDPLALDDVENGKKKVRGLPLLLDAYVDVIIQGNETRQLIELPRRAVRNGDQVYLLKDGKLEIRQLDIAWRRPESVLVESGLKEGAVVVTGPLASPVEGMPLKAANQQQSDSENRTSEDNGDRKSDDGRRSSDDGHRTSEDNGARKSDGGNPTSDGGDEK